MTNHRTNHSGIRIPLIDMSDRHFALTVILLKDTHEDGTKEIMRAVRMIKGVDTVTPLLSTPELDVAERRANTKWQEKLHKFLYE